MTVEGKTGYRRLKPLKSLAEILDVAIGFESTARDFYTDLIPKVSKQIRYLVEEIAQEEQRHFELFSEIRAREDLKVQIAEMVEVPASDTRFSDCIQVPELGDHPDDQEILQYALGREQAAIDQYGALAKSTAPGPIRDLFIFLADEETQHKIELEKIYYQVVHTGGV